MNISFLAELIKCRKRRRIRTMMRGYRILKSSGRLGWIRHTKRELADTQISNIGPAASRHFFGAGTENAAQIVQQYVLTRIGGVGLNRALLYSIGSKNRPVSFPLPKAFQSVLMKNGFIVSVWRCSALWGAYISLLWCYGAISILRHLYDGLRCIVQSGPRSNEPYAFFVGLVRNNLPQPCEDGRSHDIISWYSNWSGAPSSLVTLRHGVRSARSQSVNGKRVEASEHALPPPGGLTGVIEFGRWALFSIVRSLADALRGRWWHSLMLAESAKAALVRHACPDQLAREYLFHFSDTIYRPLWTYEALRKEARITCYFYSTSEEFKLPLGYEPNSTYWKLMNWPLYLVWDGYQKELLRLSVSDKVNVRVVGPVWFASSAVELPILPPHSVAVFDIQPIRSSGHFGFSTMNDLGYGNPNVPMQFIQDIHAVVSSHGGVVAHKRKRHDPRSRKAYRRMVERLSRDDRFIAIEPDTSAVRVIEQCCAVISIPFTSTGVMGACLGKPSAYYDPTCRLQKDDKGAHGVPLLRGRDELQAWVSAKLGRGASSPVESNSAQPFLSCNESDTQSLQR